MSASTCLISTEANPAAASICRAFCLVVGILERPGHRHPAAGDLQRHLQPGEQGAGRLQMLFVAKMPWDEPPTATDLEQKLGPRPDQVRPLRITFAVRWRNLGLAVVFRCHVANSPALEASVSRHRAPRWSSPR